MFLKNLEVFGFKSFADRTRIEFSAGITALLGPNGCGKSNVVDAVKWVLGEQAAKTMRAEKMEDVIFNGTESRKPLNVAEVSLTISNDEGLLPIDTSEITIKRRLYRSGEGEYWINNQQCKLRDVRELFWDTGVGKAAYSVMEQGKIDQILSSKPEDRRYLFEEAAGITRFKVKRAEAERKLERTEDNMRQIELTLTEVKRSYDSLKIQADKTITHRKLKDDIFNYELDIQLLRLKGFIQDRHNRESDIEKAREGRSRVQAQMDEVNAAMSEHMDEVNEMESRLVKIQQKIYGLAIEERSKNEQCRLLEQSKHEAKEKINQLEVKKKGVEEKIEILTDDADEQEGSLHNLNKRLEEIAKNICSFEENITVAGSRITENDRRSVEIEKEISVLDVKRSELQKQLEAITENIVTQLDIKLKEAGYSVQGAKNAQDRVENLVAQLKVLASGRRKLFSDFAAADSPSKADISRFGSAAVSAFSEIEKLLENLEQAVKAYVSVTPSFIEEFLSPEGIITQKRSIDLHIQRNTESVNEKREHIVSLKSQNLDLALKMEEYRVTLENLRINQAQMKTQIQSAEDQLRLLHRELSGQEAVLHDLQNELFTETKRFDDIDTHIADMREEIAGIQSEGVLLTKQLENLEKTIDSRNTDVAGKREVLTRLTSDIGKFQQQLEKASLDLATAETEIRNIQENFRDTYSRDLMEFEERMLTVNVPAAQLREQLTLTRQALRDLGSVNYLAPEEFAETKKRFDFLTVQIADLQKAKDDLKRITEEIRAESTELFLATYNKIKKNFHNMFRRLFGGGRAELRLVDPQNVLLSGIDIFAQPPGKKLENIALLSGGEKTMTAVSLLFATYMVRPSPFCLLDEIDAALDEANVLRFVQTLREFGNVSQYIVITHNKKTVAGAGTLLGVTMEESGVSKLITIKLENDSEGNIILPEPEPFEEEDVEPEQNVYIPPHPPKRRKTAAGTPVPETEDGSEKPSDVQTD
ncbi:AAA family ATPase [Treponema sp. OMZ 840]|uniref:chromosome segregation SMC family protein n=1 Tax=Treponema sp. OMZ 840 TaxID=244313 RepID=UPI003D8CD5C0